MGLSLLAASGVLSGDAIVLARKRLARGVRMPLAASSQYSFELGFRRRFSASFWRSSSLSSLSSDDDDDDDDAAASRCCCCCCRRCFSLDFSCLGEAVAVAVVAGLALLSSAAMAASRRASLRLSRAALAAFLLLAERRIEGGGAVENSNTDAPSALEELSSTARSALGFLPDRGALRCWLVVSAVVLELCCCWFASSGTGFFGGRPRLRRTVGGCDCGGGGGRGGSISFEDDEDERDKYGVSGVMGDMGGGPGDGGASPSWRSSDSDSALGSWWWWCNLRRFRWCECACDSLESEEASAEAAALSAALSAERLMPTADSIRLVLGGLYDVRRGVLVLLPTAGDAGKEEAVVEVVGVGTNTAAAAAAAGTVGRTGAGVGVSVVGAIETDGTIGGGATIAAVARSGGATAAGAATIDGAVARICFKAASCSCMVLIF